MVPIGDVQSRNLPEEFANPANQIITGDGPDVMADFIFTDESRLRLVALNKIVQQLSDFALLPVGEENRFSVGIADIKVIDAVDLLRLSGVFVLFYLII